MPFKFVVKEAIQNGNVITTRLGAGSGAANNVDQKEVGKLVKLAGDSRHDLCAAGDAIEARIEAVEPATQDGFTIGSVVKFRPGDVINVKFDGAQATPGMGAVAVGDYVVAGSIVAKGTELAQGDYPKVCKATVQPGTTDPAALTNVKDQFKVATYAWRIVSLGQAGTGAVGTIGAIERVG